MKNKMIIAQTILSGCVGAIIGIGSSQAQKLYTMTVPQSEVRTRRLDIVDEHNKERGRFDAYADGAEIRLQAPKAFMQLTASDKVGSSLSMKEGEHHAVQIGAAKQECGIHLLHETHSVSLSAGSHETQMMLAEHPRVASGLPALFPPIPDANTNRKSHMIIATVDEGNSSLGAYGQNAYLTVGNEKVNKRAILGYNIAQDSGSIDLRGPDRFHWSQPEMFGIDK